MRSQLRFVSRIVFLMMACSLAQCAKKTKSQDVRISITPNSPIVFTNDFPTTIGGQPVTINGPWFNFSVSIDNQSDTAVTIIGLHIEVTGFDANNQAQTVTQDFVPATDNVSNTTVNCAYSDYGEFEGKGKATGKQVSSGPLFETPTGSAGCSSGPVSFFSKSDPPPAHTAQIRYTVKVKPIGYFGVRNVPVDRFDNYGTFYTQ